MAPAPINQVPNEKQMEEVSDDINYVNDIKAKLKEKFFRESLSSTSRRTSPIFEDTQRPAGCESNMTPGCLRRQIYFTPRPPLPRHLLRTDVYLLFLLLLKAICAPRHFYAS